VVAVVTVVIGALTLLSAFADGIAAVDAGVRIIVSVLLFVLAIAIGALALAPGFVRGLIVRG